MSFVFVYVLSACAHNENVNVGRRVCVQSCAGAIHTQKADAMTVSIVMRTFLFERSSAAAVTALRKKFSRICFSHISKFSYYCAIRPITRKMSHVPTPKAWKTTGASAVADFVRQLPALMRKNALAYKRNWKSTLLQVSLNCLFAICPLSCWICLVL